MYRPAKPSWLSARQPVAEMQMTPLIGVLQAVMVVALVALPLSTHSVGLAMPQGTCPPIQSPELLRLSLKRTGELYLNGAPVNRVELKANLSVAAARSLPAQVELVAEADASYADFAQALSVVDAVGLDKIITLDR